MAKKPINRTRPGGKKKDAAAPEANAPVFVERATLTIKNYNQLAENQKAELQDWLRQRIAELQGQQAAIADTYTSRYSIPKETKQ